MLARPLQMRVRLANKFAIRTISEMGFPFFDQRLFKALYLGLPALKSAQWLSLIKELSDDEPYSYLRIKSFAELLETALAPSLHCIHRKLIRN